MRTLLLYSSCLISSISSFSIIPQGSSIRTFTPTKPSSSTFHTFFAESDDSAEQSDAKKSDKYSIPFDPSSSEELMYALGVNLARQLGDIRPLVQDGNELANVAKGLLDCVVGRLEEEYQVDLLSRRGKELNELIVSRADNLRKKVEEMGRNMLKEMSATEGTVTLESGVVVHPLEPGPEGFGAGTRPTAASSVKVHYHGTLPDGTVFDSSLVKGKDPVTFALGQVIPGWKEGLLKMHEGETAMLGIPPEMGYGMEGTPDGSIPGGATLFFKVQLLEVLTAGIGGTPTLIGSDGKKLGSKEPEESTSGLLGPDGKPLF